MPPAPIVAADASCSAKRWPASLEAACGSTPLVLPEPPASASEAQSANAAAKASSAGTKKVVRLAAPCCSCHTEHHLRPVAMQSGQAAARRAGFRS